ncbi:hypothetical protein [Bryobacter aggregatus]|uniref:hypothetical protein n=1 Tax=Bryobacter aggregatus TaxID=360054 RepID=UPI0004E17C81|nr:hypothetical protein [Bryobacter aggregatus]
MVSPVYRMMESTKPFTLESVAGRLPLQARNLGCRWITLIAVATPEDQWSLKTTADGVFGFFDLLPGSICS